MTQPLDSREVSCAFDLEDESKVPSHQGDGSTSLSDDEGWQTCSSRTRCRRPKWTQDEEMILVEAHCTLGNAWVAIAECLPGRSPIEVKNIWHSTLRARKLQIRSVLRTYVTALKGRSDKPSARHQAMRAAQLFLNEVGGEAVSLPSKKVRRETELQRPSQQQQHRSPQQIHHQPHQQVQLQREQQQHDQSHKEDECKNSHHANLTATLSRPQHMCSPLVLTSSEMGVAAVGVMAAATGASSPAAVLPGGAGHFTFHRSSLGSDWSCMSSGTAEPSWPPAASTATASANPAAVAGAPMMSYWPLRHAGVTSTPAAFITTPAPAASLTSHGADVPTAITTGAACSRFLGSPFLDSHPPLTGTMHLSRPRLPTSFKVTDAMTAAAAVVDYSNTNVQSLDVDWDAIDRRCAGLRTFLHSGDCSLPSGLSILSTSTAPALDLNLMRCAPTMSAAPAAAYVESSGNVWVSGSCSSGNLCRLWREAGIREVVGLSDPHSVAPVVLAMESGPAAAAASAGSCFKSPAAIAAQLRSILPSVSSLPCNRFGQGLVGTGSDAGVVTLGLYGMMDSELLACLEV